LLLGSCFADNVGKKLIEYKFDALSNPYGTIYNPLILCKLLMHTIHNESLTAADLVHHNDLYFHLDLHHSFAAIDEHIFLKKYVQAKEKLLYFIKNGKFLILTLGTAIGYKLKETGNYVGNCHKMPAKHFVKTKITSVEITTALSETIEALKKLNPELQIILTVSPVRHIKDGIIENNRSKSRLISSIEQIVSQDDSIQYFPAYELLIDDLRDYRFYEADLVHPNQMAIDYIWDKFISEYATVFTQNQLKQIKKILSAINHKAFNPASSQHQNFLKQTLELIDELEASLKVKLFENEREEIASQIFK